jgi:hypothetical protein
MSHERESHPGHAHRSAGHDAQRTPGRTTLGSGQDAPAYPAPGRTTLVAQLEPAYAVAGVIQRKARDASGVAGDAEPAIAAAATSSSAALPAPLLRKFEASLGAELSGVRIHTGGASADAAHAVGARAYTLGQGIHFGAGQYDPSSAGGEHLIAHEVAHTVQQRGGAAVRQHKLEVSAPGDAAEHEADRAADAMVAGRPALATSTAAGSRTLHRSFLPSAAPASGGSKPTIGYPPGLAAACPSLAMSGPVEAQGHAALDTLAGAAQTAETRKQDLDTAWRKVTGIDISALSRDDGKAISAATRAPGADNKARASTEAVTEQLNKVGDERKDLADLVGQCRRDHDNLVGFQSLRNSIEADKQAASKTTDLKQVDDSATLNAIGNLLGQIATGVVGEAAKLFTVAAVEHNPVSSNPPAAPGADPKPKFQGTILATLLEDGAAGAIGLIPVFIDSVRGLDGKKDQLKAEIARLQDTSTRLRCEGYARLVTTAVQQLDADTAKLATLRERIVRDTMQLKQRVADMSRDIDQQTGGKTFSRIAADVGIVDDVTAKVEPYTTACRELQTAAATAATAASAARSAPSGPISRLFGFGAPPAYDPSNLVSELTTYGQKQDAEIQDATGRRPGPLPPDPASGTARSGLRQRRRRRPGQPVADRPDAALSRGPSGFGRSSSRPPAPLPVPVGNGAV